MRIALCLAVLVASLVAGGPAAAGNTAEARVLGFSNDEGLFAFEEFGIQDGSGFPFANIYVIDTATDSWIDGTPIRVRLEGKEATVRLARQEAEARLSDLVGDVIEPSNAITLAHSPLGEFDDDEVRETFGARIPSNPLDDVTSRYEARLDIFHADAEFEDCEVFIGEPPNGFRLIVDNLESGSSAVLSEDGTIPESRGCPITYRISRVVVPSYPPDRVAVLLSVFTPGFEGPDRSFIAVTGRLPE